MNYYQREIQAMEDAGSRAPYEALYMMLGTKLGAGSTRRVYENDLNKLQVLKIDLSSDFANVMEWTIWQELKNTELGKWLAPCDFISPGGDILIQRRTHQPKNFPDWIPSIFTDLKLTNFGVIDGQFVCHDYGLLQLDKLLSPTRIRYQKADWWRLGEV